jgi:hypothetical protein
MQGQPASPVASVAARRVPLVVAGWRIGGAKIPLARSLGQAQKEFHKGTDETVS